MCGVSIFALNDHGSSGSYLIPNRKKGRGVTPISTCQSSSRKWSYVVMVFWNRYHRAIIRDRERELSNRSSRLTKMITIMIFLIIYWKLFYAVISLLQLSLAELALYDGLQYPLDFFEFSLDKYPKTAIHRQMVADIPNIADWLRKRHMPEY